MPPPVRIEAFALSVPGALEELATQAGLTPIEAVDADCPWLYADLETALRGLLSSGPVIKAMQKKLKLSEDAAALGFAKHHAGRFVFDHDENQWFRFVDAVGWELDADRAIKRATGGGEGASEWGTNEGRATAGPRACTAEPVLPLIPTTISNPAAPTQSDCRIQKAAPFFAGTYYEYMSQGTASGDAGQLEHWIRGFHGGTYHETYFNHSSFSR